MSMVVVVSPADSGVDPPDVAPPATEPLAAAGMLVPEPEVSGSEPPGRLSAPWDTRTPEPFAPAALEPLRRATSKPSPSPEPELRDPSPVPSLPWVGIVMSAGSRAAAAPRGAN
jgi:hypothetical protein